MSNDLEVPPEVWRVLQERFRASLTATLDRLRALGGQLAIAPTDPAILGALRGELHRVHGTAGSYGYDEASRIARTLEVETMAWLGGTVRDGIARAEVVRECVDALARAFERSEPAVSPPAR